MKPSVENGIFCAALLRILNLILCVKGLFDIGYLWECDDVDFLSFAPQIYYNQESNDIEQIIDDDEDYQEQDEDMALYQ